MWYRLAKKYNMFGLPIYGDRKYNLFADEDVDETETAETPLELPADDLNEDINDQLEDESDTPNLDDITIDDPSGDNNFTLEDLQDNVQKIENDPTALIQLPPLHDRCHCVIETLPILSIPGIKDGKRVWQKSENCCPKCNETAIKFNEAEVLRLLSKGIDINRIP
jgi:hypothetical protein